MDMKNDPLPQLTARTYSVVDLVSATRTGRMRVPEFQRPLRWQWPDVQKLFDSILKGYPIGNLLLWKKRAPQSEISFGAIHLDAPAFDEAHWVVDGQQRITSLANALSPEGMNDERFRLAYDLNKNEFTYPSKEDNGYIIPLYIIYDLQKLIAWFTKEHQEASDKLNEASRVTKSIREYQIPAYLVEQEDATDLRIIFDRMNNYGKRLKLAEVFSALHFNKNNNTEPQTFQKIAESINAGRNFGIIDDDTVMRALLARRGGDVTRDIRIEFKEPLRKRRDFHSENAEESYEHGEAALKRAVAFLQEHAGIPHFAFLPYRYLLVVLTRFFAHFPDPHPRNIELLKRWFWRAAMAGPGPFSSSWTNAARMLANRIIAEDETGSISRLLDKPFNNQLSTLNLTGFRTTSAHSRIIMSALWAKEPRSPISGKPYSRQDLIDKLEPDGTLRDIALRIYPREPEAFRAWTANRIIIIENELEEPIIKLMKAQSDDHVHANEFFKSHGFDSKSWSALINNNKTDLFTYRQHNLSVIVNDFLAKMSGHNLEDTPPLSIFDLDEPDEPRDEAFI